MAMADDAPASSARSTLADHSLQRAAPLRVAFRRRRTISKNRDGTSECCDLSTPVDHIDSFVSHTWNTRRRKKFMALSLHFGFPLAYASVWLVGCAISTLGALGVLPFAEMESVTILHGPPSPPSGPHAKVLCPVVFWLVLFLHQDLVPRPSCRRHHIFLDKVCIHQTDTKLQKEGIAHLAMFLLFSGQLVVLEGDDYLERLWTVYELATFLTLQPDGRVVILPVNLPMGVVALTMSVMLHWSLRTNVVDEVLEVSAHTMWFSVVVLITHTLLSVVLMRRWATEQEKRAHHLQHHFSVRSARCTNEDDRAPVMANITALFQFTSRLEHGEDATDVFDTMVRQEVPEALEKSVGLFGVPYTYVLAAGAVFVGNGFDSKGEEIAADSTFRGACPRCWHWAALHFAVFPWLVVFMCVAARGCLQLRGFVLYANLAVAGFALVLVYLGVQNLYPYLRAAADRSDAALIIYFIVTLVMSLAAHCCLQPHMKVKGYSTSDDASLQLANRLCLQIQFCRDEVASQTLSGSVASEQAHQQPQRRTEHPGARARNYRHSTSNFGFTLKTLAPPSAAALSRVASQHINVEAAARGTHRFRAVLYATSQQMLESFSLRQRPRLSN